MPGGSLRDAAGDSRTGTIARRLIEWFRTGSNPARKRGCSGSKVKNG